MPSILHETLIEMFRHRPSLAAELLTDALGLELPAYQQARLDPGELIDLAPTEYRADAVVVLAAVDEQHAALYSDVVLATLPAAARRYLEGLMSAGTYEYQSEFVRRYIVQGRAEGRVEGQAAAVLAVLDARGVEVPEDVRIQVTECRDPDQLDAWLRRAVTADSAHDLFA